MKAFVAVMLVLIVAALGYMILDKKWSENAVRQELQRQAERERIVAKAILEHRVEVGMTGHEVRRAWGTDYRVRGTTPEFQKSNIYQTWHFDRNIVYLDLTETVVKVTHH